MTATIQAIEMTKFRTLDERLTPDNCLQVVEYLTHPHKDILEIYALRNVPHLLPGSKMLVEAKKVIDNSKHASHTQMRLGLAKVLTAQGKIEDALKTYAPLPADDKSVRSGILETLTVHFMAKNSVYENIEKLKAIYNEHPQAARQHMLRPALAQIKTCMEADIVLQKVVADPIWQCLQRLFKDTPVDDDFFGTLAADLATNYRKQVDALYSFYNRAQYTEPQDDFETIGSNSCAIL